MHKGTLTIETPRLILRRFIPDDLKFIFNNCWSEFDVWKWTNYAPMNALGEVISNANMFTPAWLNAYERLDRYSWAICLKTDGLPIGRMFGMHPTDKDVELAYELGSRWWNQGLMTEAADAAINFFLKDVALHRIYAHHADQNPASGRVMQKCGMQYIGTVVGGCKCNAGIFDRVEYEILA